MEEALDPGKKLIGFAGKDLLKEGLDEAQPNRELVKKFINNFRDVHSFHGPTISPIIPLLTLGGVSRNRAAAEVLTAMVETMKRQIAGLEQEPLEALLDKCYTFLTVPKLAPVGIAVLERLNFVDPEIWNQIVANGLEESPYIDLPISIKRRIWSAENKAFDHEVDKLISRVGELSPPTGLDEFILRGNRHKMRMENLLLKDLLNIAAGLEDPLIAVIVDKMVDAFGKEQTNPKRLAIANLFHDFMVQFSSRTSSNLGTLRRMARFLDSGDSDADLDEQLLHDIRLALGNRTSCGPVALLVASTYSRDLLADQLVIKLLNRRGNVSDLTDPQMLENAANHLREDGWIHDLTYACLCNMKAHNIIQHDEPLEESEVDVPFAMFYPYLINEMELDYTKQVDDYFTSNADLPNPKFLEMVRVGRLERRVVTTYCLLLQAHTNIIGLCRFRLVLDNSLRACDNLEEMRETALAYHLIMKVVLGE